MSFFLAGQPLTSCVSPGWFLAGILIARVTYLNGRASALQVEGFGFDPRRAQCLFRTMQQNFFNMGSVHGHYSGIFLARPHFLQHHHTNRDQCYTNFTHISRNFHKFHTNFTNFKQISEISWNFTMKFSSDQNFMKFLNPTPRPSLQIPRYLLH